MHSFRPVPACAALALCFSFTSVLAQDLCQAKELNINGASKHFYETRYSAREGWNEVNAGLGLTCHLQGLGNWNDEFELGFLENSRRKTTLYGAYGLYYPVNRVVSTGIKLILASGYESYVRTNGIIGGPMPTIKFQLNNKLSVNLSLAPRANTFIFANVGIKF